MGTSVQDSGGALTVERVGALSSSPSLLGVARASDAINSIVMPDSQGKEEESRGGEHAVNDPPVPESRLSASGPSRPSASTTSSRPRTPSHLVKVLYLFTGRSRKAALGAAFRRAAKSHGMKIVIMELDLSTRGRGRT